MAGKSILIEVNNGGYRYSFESIGIYLGIGFDLQLNYGLGVISYKKAAWFDSNDIFGSTYICDATSFPFEIENNPDSDLSMFEIDIVEVFEHPLDYEVDDFEIDFNHSFEEKSNNISGFSINTFIISIGVAFLYVILRRKKNQKSPNLN